MVVALVATCLFGLSNTVSGQEFQDRSTIVEEHSVTAEPITIGRVAVKPTFEGGNLKDFCDWVGSRFSFSDIVKKSGSSCRWSIQFVIDTVGSVTDVKILQGYKPSADKKLAKVISRSPKWTPGMQDGNVVPVLVSFEVESEVEAVNAIPFPLVEVKPTFDGDDVDSFSKWVNTQLHYPEIAMENGIQGRVTLQFIVGVDGVVKNVRVIRGVDPSLDREAVRVVSMSPKWTPGKQKKREVPVLIMIPIDFCLTDDSSEEDVSTQLTIDNAIPSQVVEVRPTFEGGDINSFSKWVNTQLRYPEVARANGVQGRVTLQFIVDVDGSVTNVKVLKRCDPSLDREAVRVLSSSPKWTPGMHDGKPVPVLYVFPVIFQITAP